MKIAVSWGRNETFDCEKFKSIKGDISDGGNEYIFAIGKVFPIPRVTHKGSGEGGTVHTWWVQQFCDIFGKKGDAWHMILGDNPAGHGFVLRDLVLIELSGHAPPPAWGRGLKISEKSLLGVSEILILLGEVILLGEGEGGVRGHVILK